MEGGSEDDTKINPGSKAGAGYKFF